MSSEASVVEKLKGPFPVLPTVFKDDFSLDLDGLGDIIDRLLDKGISGLTLLGSGAETPFLDAEERRSLLEFAVRRIDGRATVISGVIQWGTRQAIDEARCCRDAGADALMLALPLYYRTTPGQVLRHYEAVVEQVDHPTIYYHYPECTGLSLSRKQMARLFREVDLCGIKESGFSTPELAAHIRLIDRPIRVFTGQSFNFLQALKRGAVGAICPLGVLMPETSLSLVEAYNSGDLAAAAAAQRRIFEGLPVLSPSLLPHWLVRRALKRSLSMGFKLPKPPGVYHAGLKEALLTAGVIKNATVRPPQPKPPEAKKRQIAGLASALCEL